MDNKPLPTLLAGLVLFFMACGPSADNQSANTVESEVVQKEEIDLEEEIEVSEENKIAKSYEISGMVCEFGCAKFIEDEVSSHAGVLDFNIDFENKTAEIVFDKSRTSSEDIMAFVEGLNEGQYEIAEASADAKPVPNGPTSTQQHAVDSSAMLGAAEVGISRMNSFKFDFPKIITYFMKRL